MANVIQEVPEDFIVLSGDDAVTIPLVALGGRGIVSVASNEIPAEMTQIAQAALRNDFATARRLQRRYLPLLNVNFVESNPIPVKTAMAMMGLLEPVYRLPLVQPSEANWAKIEKVLSGLGLLACAHAGGALSDAT
jgi:4-hydroxy-tetrahydrodipicolinate synthase